MGSPGKNVNPETILCVCVCVCVCWGARVLETEKLHDSSHPREGWEGEQAVTQHSRRRKDLV